MNFKLKIVVLTLTLFVCNGFSSIAQPPAGDAKVGDVYGETITGEGAVSVNELPKLLSETDSMDIKITGVVKDVCPKKGCWVSLELEDKSTVFVKMKDYAFFVPTAAIGKTVALEGLAYNELTSVEELRHYARDAKMSEKEIKKIKKPRNQIRFLADGIVVVE